MAPARGRPRRPKIAAVAALLAQYPDEIEADIARYYPGHDIADFWRGTMSGRKLAVLVRHLPEDSATVKAQRGSPWSDLMYLVAYLADTVAYSRADYLNAHGASARPTPVPRPQTEADRAEREQVHLVHDALVDMMHGHVPADAPSGDGRLYQPQVIDVA